MKKRILSLALALVMLVGLLPTAGLAVTAAEAQGRPDSGITMGSNGGGGATNPASAAIDTSVDYCAILGISKATAENFGKQIRDSFRVYDFDIALTGTKINLNSTQREKNAFSALLEHEVFYHYETFMFEVVHYNYYRDSKDNVTRIVFEKDDLLKRYKSYTNYLADLTAVQTIAENMLEGIKGNNNLHDVKKALLLHDRLAAWTQYDHDNYKSDSCPDESYTIVGALWKQVSVCQGYSETYAYLLDQCGIKSRMAQSSELDHIWNIVTIGSKEYYVDVTWDDPSSYDMYGQVEHDNFLVSLTKLRQNHKADDYSTIKNDTQYDNGFWIESRAEFQLIGDKDIYYLDNQEEEGPCFARLHRWTDNTRYQVLLFNDPNQMKWTWYNGGVWNDRNFACLDSWDGKLYVNGAKSIYEFDPATSQFNICFTPALPHQTDSIYGFTIWNGRYLLNLLNDWPKSESAADSQRYHYDPKTVASVSLYKKPTQTTYKVNTPYDFRGLTLKVTYTDGSSVLIKNQLHSYDYQTTASTGKKTIKVGLFGKTTSFTLDVITGLATPKLTVKNIDTGINISWKKVSYAKQYIVYRSYKSGSKWSSWTKMCTTTSTSYTNKNPQDGKVYRYAVRAYSGSLKSSLGQSSEIRRLKTPTAKVTNATSGTYLSWKKVTGATKYLVYRSYYKSGKWTSWTQIGSTTKLTYTDQKTSANVRYRYAVKAANGSQKSASGTTGEIRRLKSATVTAKKSGTTIKVSWGKVTGAKQYVVYRRAAGSSAWSKMTTTKNLSYTDKSAKKGKYYEYAVRAVNGEDMSAYKACKKVKR